MQIERVYGAQEGSRVGDIYGDFAGISTLVAVLFHGSNGVEIVGSSLDGGVFVAG